jgi:putative transposon-encoded protein
VNTCAQLFRSFCSFFSRLFVCGVAPGCAIKSNEGVEQMIRVSDIRRVVRIGSSYYVSVPKRHLARLRVFRNMPVCVYVEGSKVIFETDKEKFYGRGGKIECK